MEQRTSSRHTFLKNAAVLTVSALILRALSLLLRVWLAQKIGPAGIGQYQLILSIFLPAVSIASGGISLTVTRLTSLALGQKSHGVFAVACAGVYFLAFALAHSPAFC